jgi:colicin import membrane protein
MKSLIRSALILTLTVFVSFTVSADAQLDSLLNKIDSDIAAKRLSNPAGNNAIEKIWQFKALAPYDQRINSRAYSVGEVYVTLANKSISAKKFSKAQLHLDKAWMLAYLTPGLESTQDSLDKVYKSSASKRVAKQSKPAPKKQTAKANNSNSDKAKKQKQLAATKLARQKADKQAAERRRLAEETERRLAKLRKEQAVKAKAAQKLASLEAKRQKAAKFAAQSFEVTSKSIADFNLDQNLIDNRETRAIRTALGPICKEIIDNDASVVLNTRNKQDYRWLTVRLTLCVRRIDKEFRLRHSHKEVADADPSISLHPGRSMSLMQKSRG